MVQIPGNHDHRFGSKCLLDPLEPLQQHSQRLMDPTSWVDWSKDLTRLMGVASDTMTMTQTASSWAYLEMGEVDNGGFPFDFPFFSTHKKGTLKVKHTNTNTHLNSDPCLPKSWSQADASVATRASTRTSRATGRTPFLGAARWSISLSRRYPLKPIGQWLVASVASGIWVGHGKCLMDLLPFWGHFFLGDQGKADITVLFPDGQAGTPQVPLALVWGTIHTPPMPWDAHTDFFAGAFKTHPFSPRKLESTMRSYSPFWGNQHNPAFFSSGGCSGSQGSGSGRTKHTQPGKPASPHWCVCIYIMFLLRVCIYIYIADIHICMYIYIIYSQDT